MKLVLPRLKIYGMPLSDLLSDPNPEKNIVDCKDCPAYEVCQLKHVRNDLFNARNEDWGFHICASCKSTGLLSSSSQTEDGKLKPVKQRVLYVLDCAKQDMRPIKSQVTPCELCDGRLMKYHLLSDTHARRIYVPTIHAAVPLQERLVLFRDRFKFWKMQIDKREAEIMLQKHATVIVDERIRKCSLGQRPNAVGRSNMINEEIKRLKALVEEAQEING